MKDEIFRPKFFSLLKEGISKKQLRSYITAGVITGIAVVIFSTQINDAFRMNITDMPTGFIGKWGVYIGPVFGTIPNTFSIPAIDIYNIPHYLAPALTIAFLGAIESLLSAVVADGMSGSNHRSNTELIAQGIANTVSPLAGGIPATWQLPEKSPTLKVVERPLLLESEKKVILSGVRPGVLKELEKNRLDFLIGRGNIFSNFDQAIEKALKVTESSQQNKPL